MVDNVINESNDANFKLSSPALNNGISLQNIHQRLDRMYGNEYSLKIDQSEANKFKVEFKLPLNG